MKLLTGPALLVSALFSVLAVLPFVPARPNDRFHLQARMTSSVSGQVEVYWDSGAGFREADSELVPIAPGEQEQLIQFDIPPGVYRQLRFDPIDREGTVTIRQVQVLDPEGRLVRSVPLGRFQALNQIQSLSMAGGRLRSVAVPGGDDPQLLLPFDPPLALEFTPKSFQRLWLERAGALFLVLGAGLFLLDRIPGPRARLFQGIRAWSAARPELAVGTVALLASLASAYPVVFLGKSYVSPNFGTLLLYDRIPTLPGYSDRKLADPMGSDVGAIMWQHVPFSAIQHRSLLRDGEIPFWNRYNSGGNPLLGQGQSMAGDPLHLIAILADGASWSWDLKYVLAKALFAAGIGLGALALTRHLPASIACALAAPFVGFFVYRINHPAFFSLCYAPWPLYCWIRVAQARSARSTAGWLGGLMLSNLALMGSGTVKEAYVLLVLVNFSGVCALLACPDPWSLRLRKLAGAAWAGALFALISAPLWDSFLTTLASARTSYDIPSASQIQPGMLLGAFDEILYRPLNADERVFNPSANFLILAGVLYLIATLRHNLANRVAMALAASSLLPLVFAFGMVPPQWVIRVPFLSRVSHIDDTFSCGLIVLWAVLAGVGFATAARRLGRPEGRGDLVVCLALLFALIFAYFGFRQAIQRQAYGPGSFYTPNGLQYPIPLSPFIRWYLLSLIAAVVALGWLSRHALRLGRIGPASSLGICLCLLLPLWRQGLQAGTGFPKYTVQPPLRVDFHAASSSIDFIKERQSGAPSRVVGMDNNLFPGWNDMYGVEGINGPDALMNRFYRELTFASPISHVWDWRLVVSSQNIAAARPILDALNVRYYLDLDDRNRRPLSRAFQLVRRGDLDVYESPTCWPRAFFTDRASSESSGEDFVGQVAHGDGRPFAALAPETASAQTQLAALLGEQAGRTIVRAKDYHLTENSTAFDVDAPGPGLVVLNETYWPGYSHAEVDGRSAQVVRANHAFQGIPITTKGHHHIVVRYRPRKATLCLEACLLGLALTAGSGLALFRRRNPAP